MCETPHYQRLTAFLCKPSESTKGFQGCLQKCGDRYKVAKQSESQNIRNLLEKRSGRAAVKTVEQNRKRE